MREVHSDIRGPLFYEALDIEKRGGKVLKLNTGNPASFGFKMPKSVIEAITGDVERALGYCDFRGMPEAREAIMAYHKNQGFVGIDEDDVFIGNGVSEVVSFALDGLLDAHDEVLLPCPCYPLWSNCTRISGGVPVFYKLDEENGWQPDTDDIRAKITDRTRAIVIINPNNPTGAVYSKEILLEIAEIARFARSLPNVHRMHLLPYHRLGQDKYAGLSREYGMGDLEPPTPEKMRRLLSVAEESGLICRIGG